MTHLRGRMWLQLPTGAHRRDEHLRALALMLYLDASALVKRYIEEDGSELVVSEMAAADAWSMCRIGYVETVRAVGIAGGRRAIKRIEADW